MATKKPEILRESQSLCGSFMAEAETTTWSSQNSSCPKIAVVLSHISSATRLRSILKQADEGLGTPREESWQFPLQVHTTHARPGLANASSGEKLFLKFQQRTGSEVSQWDDPWAILSVKNNLAGAENPYQPARGAKPPKVFPLSGRWEV